MIELEPELALIARLAKDSPSVMGRTALMKFCYFLDAIRGVRLHYRFTLYSYGPFDDDVLYDLGNAENFGLVKENVIYFPSGNGYGYEIRSLLDDDAITALAPEFFQRHASDIQWVLQRFGSCTASELELYATIVYADRQVAAEPNHQSVTTLASTVHAIKPKFNLPEVEAKVRELQNEDLLRGLSA